MLWRSTETHLLPQFPILYGCFEQNASVFWINSINAPTCFAPIDFGNKTPENASNTQVTPFSTGKNRKEGQFHETNYIAYIAHDHLFGCRMCEY